MDANKVLEDNPVQQVSPSQLGGGVGSTPKEKEPISHAGSGFELVKPSEEQPKIPKEVAEIGVEAVGQDKVPLEGDHKGAGIQHGGELVSVATGVLPQLPSEQEVQETIKTTSNSDSRHWLYKLFERVYKQLGY